ncbi:MAG: hypothetical protein ACTH0V_00400 [Microbacteriaceae bacterium]
MSTINPAAAKAREASRQATGEFGKQQHNDPAHDLPAPKHAATEAFSGIREGDPFELGADDFGSAQELRDRITDHGWHAAIEHRQEYLENNVHDGEVEYDREEFTVHGFKTKRQLDEFLDGRGLEDLGSSGDVYVDPDHRTIDYVEGRNEQATFFVARPERPAASLDNDELDAAAESAAGSFAWQATDDDGEPYEGDVDLDDEGREFLRAELDDFQSAYPDLVDEARERGYGGDDFAGQFGHTFVLHAQGHGVGFADDPALADGDLGKRLDVAVGSRRVLAHVNSFANDDTGKLELDHVEYVQRNRDKADAVMGAVVDGRRVGGAGCIDRDDVRRTLQRDGILQDLSYRSRRMLDELDESRNPF